MGVLSFTAPQHMFLGWFYSHPVTADTKHYFTSVEDGSISEIPDISGCLQRVICGRICRELLEFHGHAYIQTLNDLDMRKGVT